MRRRRLRRQNRKHHGGRHTRYIVNATRWCWVVIALYTGSRAAAHTPLLPGELREMAPQGVQLLGREVFHRGPDTDLWSWLWTAATVVALWAVHKPTVQKLLVPMALSFIWSGGYFLAWGVHLFNPDSMYASPVGFLGGTLYLAFGLFMVTGSALAAYSLRLALDADLAEAINQKE